jgi:hypothetical protein
VNISQPEEIKKLLEIQNELKAIIDRLQSSKSTLPAGAFRGLTTAEDELTNALGKLEQSRGLTNDNQYP